MTRLRVLALLLVSLVSLGLAACGPPPEETPLPTFELLPTITPTGGAPGQGSLTPLFGGPTGPPLFVATTAPPPAFGAPTLVIGPDLTGTPSPSPTPCTVDSDFVADVTIPDGTVIQIGRRFTKTWRLLNSGTCAWDAGFRFQKIEGVALNVVEAAILLPFTLPGEEVDVSVTLVLPLGTPPGDYRARFQIAAPNGTLFGARPFVVVNAVPPGEGIEPTSTPAGGASVAGAVWADSGDGALDDSDPRIGGLTLHLLSFACEAEGGQPLTTALTDGLGTYRFEGLAAGDYCVVIDPNLGSNFSILIPGQWIVPPPVPDTQTARLTVNLGDNEARVGVNFGWQFDNP